MTPDQAYDLVARIEATWPDGRWTQPRRGEWAEELEQLDVGRARVAFQNLKRTTERTPPISAFLDAYRAQERRLPSKDRADCERCSDSGWVYSHFTSDDRPDGKPPLVYEFSKPCPECAAGIRTAQALEKTTK